MLRTAPKGTTAPAWPVTPEEDRLLRAAFGRFGGQMAARFEAAAVVARHQQLEGGRWFLCDCFSGAERPPALVPVSQTHIRRHEDTRWPVHCDTCDFHRDPEEQQAVTASYTPPSASKPLRLTRPLGRAAPRARPRFVAAVSHHAKRPGIARLLTALVTGAGLQAIGADWRAPSLVDQIKAIWSAAKAMEIDAGVRLPEFLCTSPARLDELRVKIAGVTHDRFAYTRPHGVLIVRVAAIGQSLLQPVSGEPIPVRGRLAVFGERVDAGREAGAKARAERTARAPYLAACVIGRAEEAARSRCCRRTRIRAPATRI